MLRKGGYLYNSPPYVKKADAPTTRFFGSWGPDRQTHGWEIDVELTSPAAVLHAQV